MPSPFDDLDAELSSVVDEEFGEEAVISPRLAAQYLAATADPDRPVRTIRGIYSAGPASDRLGGRARGDMTGLTHIATETAVFWVSAAQLAALPYEIAQDDLISFPGRPGLAFKVTTPRPTDRGDLELMLTVEDPTP